MSEKKINVDMNLFNFSNKSRKKRNAEKKDGIKIKAPAERKKNETLKKRSILKMIRQHQEDRYKKLFDEKKDNNVVNSVDSINFNKEFKEAHNYLQSLTEKKKQENNTTIRNHIPNTQSLLFQPSLDPLKNSMAEVANVITHNAPINIQPAIQNIVPNYGCLKGGQLPTYRTIMNQTRKQSIMDTVRPQHQQHNTGQGASPPTTNLVGDLRSPDKFGGAVGGSHPDQQKIMEQKINDSMKRVNEMKETAAKLQQLKVNSKPRKMKRKRTLRRTYKVGKSKIAPKVSVLVSNKTIRNNTSTKSQLLKQVSIEEVKQFLVKRGLIKIGSITPNDVLRKMYESTIMMCGEVYNHNPENLMYNFFNEK